MKNRVQLLHDIKHIQKLANLHQSTPQHLMTKLDSDVTLVSMDGYTPTLQEATENGGVQITPQHIYLVPQSKHNYISIMDRKTVNHLPCFKKTYGPRMHHDIPNTDRFFLDIHQYKYPYPHRQLGRVLITQFAPLRYYDVYIATLRFFDAKHKLEHWYHLGEELQLSEVIKHLNKDIRFVQHGFIQESLDDIFSGTVIDKKHSCLRYTKHLAKIANIAISHHCFEKSNLYKKNCCSIIDLLLSNNRMMVMFGNDQSVFKQNAKRLINLFKQGYRYLVVISGLHSHTDYHVRPVNQTDAIQIINCIKRTTIKYVKSNTEKSN